MGRLLVPFFMWTRHVSDYSSALSKMKVISKYIGCNRCCGKEHEISSGILYTNRSIVSAIIRLRLLLTKHTIGSATEDSTDTTDPNVSIAAWGWYWSTTLRSSNIFLRDEIHCWKILFLKLSVISEAHHIINHRSCSAKSPNKLLDKIYKKKVSLKIISWEIWVEIFLGNIICQPMRELTYVSRFWRYMSPCAVKRTALFTSCLKRKWRLTSLESW